MSCVNRQDHMHTSGRQTPDKQAGMRYQKTALCKVSFCLLVLCVAAAADESPATPPQDAAGLILTLEAAQQRALDDNPSLQAVEMRVRQASERVKQARSAFFPSLDFDWRATHTQLPDKTVAEARQGIQSGFLATLSPTLALGAVQPLRAASSLASSAYQSSLAYDAVPESMDSYSVSLSMGYLLFNGFGRKYSYAMSRFGEKEMQARAREAQRLILGAVAQTYYGAQLASERITITEADKSFNARLLKEAQARLRVGAAARSEVLNFEVRLRASEAQQIAAMQDLHLASVALAALMGLTEAHLPEGTVFAPLELETEVETTLPEVEPLFDTAFNLRPDLEAYRHAVDRTRAGVGLQRSQYYPTLTAFASKDANRTQSGNFESDDFSTTVGIGLSLNLFSGGRRRAALAEARYASKETEFSLKEAEITVSSDVQEALARLEAAQRQLILQRENTGYVEENRDMVEKEFQVGQSSLALLNQAQRDLVEAQGYLAFARVSLRAAWHELRTATGETVQAFHEAP